MKLVLSIGRFEAHLVRFCISSAILAATTINSAPAQAQRFRYPGSANDGLGYSFDMNASVQDTDSQLNVGFFSNALELFSQYPRQSSGQIDFTSPPLRTVGPATITSSRFTVVAGLLAENGFLVGSEVNKYSIIFADPVITDLTIFSKIGSPDSLDVFADSSNYNGNNFIGLVTTTTTPPGVDQPFVYFLDTPGNFQLLPSVSVPEPTLVFGLMSLAFMGSGRRPRKNASICDDK